MLKSFLTSLHWDTRGATAVEYGLIVALIVLGMLGALQGLGASNGGSWGSINSKVTAASSAG